MAMWRVHLHGPLRLFRDGEAFRPRTRHQGLLVARLAVHGEEGVGREATAALLWPEAERGLRSAYLRRAIMELRRAGLEIEGDGDRIWPAPGSFELSEASDDAVLKGIEHPIADEIRRLQSRAPVEPTRAALVPTDSERLMMWIGETLVREHPEVAIEMLARHGADLAATLPPEPLLSLFLRALEASSNAGESRAGVIRLAAQEAMYLTRYGQAERLARWAVDECRSLGGEPLLSMSLAFLAFLQMERRRWPEALENGRLAAELAIKSGNDAAIAIAYNGLAGIRWHILLFDEALEDYARAYDAARDDGLRLRVQANVALVAGVYGKPLWASIQPPVGPFTSSGALLLAEANLRIGYGLARDVPRLVVQGCARLLLAASASGMERFFCLALDYAAYGFARLGHRTEAAVCVRIGSEHRLAVGHHRSPAESLAIRLHVPPPYFGPEIEALALELKSDDPAVCAARIATRLETALANPRTGDR